MAMTEGVVAPNGWSPGSPHPKPDPNRCPHCGEVGALRELGKRHTWQPVTLDYGTEGAEDIIPEGAEYESFDYADDVEITGYDCRSCGDEWTSIYQLAWAQRVVQALEDHIAYADAQFDVAGRKNPDDEIGETLHEATSEAFTAALAIFQGNGEA